MRLDPKDVLKRWRSQRALLESVRIRSAQLSLGRIDKQAIRDDRRRLLSTEKHSAEVDWVEQAMATSPNNVGRICVARTAQLGLRTSRSQYLIISSWSAVTRHRFSAW